MRVTQRFQSLQDIGLKSKPDKPQRFEVTGNLSRTTNTKNKIMASHKALPLPSSATGQQVCNCSCRVSAQIFAGYVCRTWTRLVPRVRQHQPRAGHRSLINEGSVAWRGWARSSAGASRGTLAPLYMSTADAINYLNDYSLFLQSLPHYSTSTGQQ